MLAKEVRELREKAGLSSKQLAKIINKNRTYISQIETGKIKFPKIEYLKQILQTLGCSDDKINKIIISQGERAYDIKGNPNKHGYIIERKMLLSKQKEVKSEGENVVETKTKVLTQEGFERKCEADSDEIYRQLLKLPKPTLNRIITLLYDHI